MPSTVSAQDGMGHTRSAQDNCLWHAESIAEFVKHGKGNYGRGNAWMTSGCGAVRIAGGVKPPSCAGCRGFPCCALLWPRTLLRRTKGMQQSTRIIWQCYSTVGSDVGHRALPSSGTRVAERGFAYPDLPDLPSYLAYRYGTCST